jgi:hypothetical protein
MLKFGWIPTKKISVRKAVPYWRNGVLYVRVFRTAEQATAFRRGTNAQHQGKTGGAE